ncbi:MAG TPA: hypothetical protein VG186_16350 [Solirubrobacteraceae bacterium]|nr:hypothetical protein [Solirubrobacteraceae bacterium]
MPARRGRAGAAFLGATVLLAACGSARSPAPEPGIPRALVAESRPIGHGARFHPPATGRVLGRCRAHLGPRIAVHVELFAANQVVLVPAGIGTRPPRRFSAGRISRARCYGDLVTLEPTGVVLVRAGTHRPLADLFRGWGEPLTPRRLASFPAAAGSRVEVFVGGRRWHRAPGSVPLTEHAEIVLEVGPHVPPHVSYTFPPGA